MSGRLLLVGVAMACSEYTEVVPRYLEGHASAGPSDGPVVEPTCFDACPGLMDAAQFLGTTPLFVEHVCADAAAAVMCLLDPPSACAGNGLIAVAQARVLCTGAGQLMAVAAVMSNQTGCEAACPGFAPVLGDFFRMNVREEMRMASEATRARRLAGHGRDTTERNAMADVLCPNSAVVECVFANDVVCNSTAAMSRPNILDNCDTLMSVSLSMGITVADPAAFVANAASAGAVESGIAAAAGIDATNVNVVLSVAPTARRLEDELRGSRRLQGAVNVEAAIQLPSAGALDTIMGIDASEMTTPLNAALTAAGLEEVTVNSLTAERGAWDGVTASTAAPLTSQNGTAASESGASSIGVTLVSSLLVAFSLQFCHF